MTGLRIWEPNGLGGSHITGDSPGLIWDANDTGTSAAFQLTAAEEGAVRRFVEQASGDPSALVPLERQGDVS